MNPGKDRQDGPLARLQQELKRPLSRWELALEGLALAGLLAAVAIVVVQWRTVPERVPIHFGLSGHPDAYGDRSALWLLLFVQVTLYLLLTGVLHLPAGVLNIPAPVTHENAPRLARSLRFMMRSLRVLVMGMIAHGTWLTVAVARGRATELSPWWNLWLVALLVLVAGFYLQIKRR